MSEAMTTLSEELLFGASHVAGRPLAEGGETMTKKNAVDTKPRSARSQYRPQTALHEGATDDGVCRCCGRPRELSITSDEGRRIIGCERSTEAGRDRRNKKPVGESRINCCSFCHQARRSTRKRERRGAPSASGNSGIASGSGRRSRGCGGGSSMRILAVTALTALSAASAFAPCHSREMPHGPSVAGAAGRQRGGGPSATTTSAHRPTSRWVSVTQGRSVSGPEAPPGEAPWGTAPKTGIPRRSSNAARTASSALAGSSRSEVDPSDPGGEGGRNHRRGLFGLFRRSSPQHATPPSLSGDAPSSLREEEMDECSLRMTANGANEEEVQAICFDPRSFDRDPLPPAAVAEGVEVPRGGGEISPGEEDGTTTVTNGGANGEKSVNEEGLELPVVAESALPEPPRGETEHPHVEDGDEICVPTFDVPATPSFELPPVFEYTVNADGDVNDELDHIDEHNLHHDDDEEEEDEDDGARAPKPRALNRRGLLLVDSFSPFHGMYLSKMAREAYGAGVVSVLSAYVTGYLYQERGMTRHLSMRLPDNLDDFGPDGEVERWVNKLPFEIVGIVCESDSGLDDAERLGEALGLYPDRHDGYNAGRRDKFLMNEAARRHGLRVVEQKLCETVEEALEFAEEMGVSDGVNGDVVVGRPEGDDEALIAEVANLVGKAEEMRANGDSLDVSGNDGADLREDPTEAAVSMDGVDLPNGEQLQEETTEAENDDAVTMEDLDVTEELCKHEPDVVEVQEEAVNGDSAALSDDIAEGAPVNGEASALEQDEETPQDQHEDEDDDDDEYIPSNPGQLGTEESTFPARPYVVVKPTRGVASDSVHLCPSLDSVSRAFESIHSSSVFGSTHGEKHSAVLLQEFAAGTEYAVDIVSKAGEHKVAALWKYDKRPANGAPFVYHATELVDADTEVGRVVCAYAMDSLDALDVHWGMSHTEIIVDYEGEDPETGERTKPRPRLVEVNCRQHNTDFAPLTTACIGYNALDMLLAAYLGDADEYPPNTEHKRLPWNDLPDLPVTRSYGAIVHLVSHAEGTLRAVNREALEEIEDMKGVVAMEVYPQCTAVGEPIRKTVDIRTDAGWCHLMGDDAAEFKGQYDRIVELMPKLFVTEEEAREEETEGDEGRGGVDQGVPDAGDSEKLEAAADS